MRAAIAIVVLLFLAAAGFLVTGIWLLVGTAWASIALGALLFCAAAYLRLGLTNG